MSTKVLLIEDDPSLTVLVQYNLEQAGYDVAVEMDGEDGLFNALTNKPDIILLDWMLPNLSGIEICRRVRRDKNIQNTPIIMLTARGEEDDRILGLDTGADDYITKPFNMKELLLRVKSILKRTSKKLHEGKLAYRDLLLDKSMRTLSVDGELIEVTKLEFDLLSEFIMNKNSVLERDFLLENVWGDSENYQYKTVNVAINRLKEKIDPTKTKEYIQTVRGVGYKLC